MELDFSVKYKTELIFVEKISEIFGSLSLKDCFIVDEHFKDASWLVNCKKVFFAEGEKSKNLSFFEKAIEWLIKNGAERTTRIVGIGGGSVTDFAGFLASVYCRGAELVLVPTTVLAAVDSAVGGKTALNYIGKNSIGSFYPAGKVIVAEEFFSSLGNGQTSDGKAEIIKVALLKGGDLAKMVKDGKDLIQPECLKLAVQDKYFFVAGDMTDKLGTRIYLNWGHTFGHAIERCYGVPHGKAVAAGMVLMQKYLKNILPEVFDPSVLEELLDLHGVNINSDAYFENIEWHEFIMFDKKKDKEEISMVYLKKIGCPDIVKRSLKEITKDLEELK